MRKTLRIFTIPLIIVILAFIVSGCTSGKDVTAPPSLSSVDETTATSSLISAENEKNNNLLGTWEIDNRIPSQADILIFNGDNTFHFVTLGDEIPFFDVHLMASGTYTINCAEQSLSLLDQSGDSFDLTYSLTEDTLTFSDTDGRYYRKPSNPDTFVSFVGDWSAYGSNDKVLTIKQDGTFQLHNVTFGDNFSSGTYTRSSNIENAIDLYDPNGDYVYTMQQLCVDLMIDENGTRFLYQKISN